ncbi:MAG: ABC transporter substrate-binding protein [Deltaproteobacteria bacterium]|nr:ABC transporter substrate-binding protein [Deltaproteobacteria bacterium]
MDLRIGHLSTFYHTSILMIARGTLGPDVEWSLLGTGPALVNAFEKGEIDLAYLGLPPAIIGMDRGVRIKCIAGGHVEGTVISSSMKFKGFPEIHDLEDILKQFAGQTIGVPGKGSIHDVIISEFLRKFNLDKDVQVVNFQWADQVLDAIHRGEVSAAVGTPALAVAVMHYADGKILYPPSELWPNNPSYGILASSDLLNKEPDKIEKFLLSHEQATSFLRNEPREAAGIIADYVGVADKAFVLDTLKVSPKYCACLTDDYIASTMEFVTVLKELGYIGKGFSSSEIFDTSFIEKIHPEKDHYNDGLSPV